MTKYFHKKIHFKVFFSSFRYMCFKFGTVFAYVKYNTNDSYFKRYRISE